MRIFGLLNLSELKSLIIIGGISIRLILAKKIGGHLGSKLSCLKLSGPPCKGLPIKLKAESLFAVLSCSLTNCFRLITSSTVAHASIMTSHAGAIEKACQIMLYYSPLFPLVFFKEFTYLLFPRR